MTRYVRMSTPSRSASARASAFGRTLKPTTIAFDADASITSDSVIPPMPVWMTFTRTSGWRIFASSPLTASIEPCTSAFTITFRSWTRAGLDLREELLERDALLRAARELLGAHALAAKRGELARLPVVLDDVGELAGARRLVEAEDLDGRARRRLLRRARRGSRGAP